jgi:hypothetical protein
MTLALVLGGGASVWADAAAALRLANPDAVFAINDMISFWPGPVHYAVSLHPDKLDQWIKARASNPTLPPGFIDIWAHRHLGPVTKVTPDWNGSSGLLAVKVALVELKMDGVILAGVPMNRTKHFVRNRVWFSASSFHNGWMTHHKAIRTRVRSMSGWTMEQFGPPTNEWLADVGARDPDLRFVDVVRNFAVPS